MRMPVWILIALLIVQLIIAVTLQVWFHNTWATAVIVAACLVQVALLKQRLRDANASTITGVRAIIVPPHRIWLMTAVVVIGVVIIAVLIGSGSHSGPAP
jgi:hypothetical protein